MRRALTEAQVRQIIRQELFYRSILGEGIWDDVRDGAKRLVKAVSGKFADQGLVQKAKQVIAGLGNMPDVVKTVMQAVKYGMQETGESIKLNDTLKVARELGSLNSEKMGAILAADLKGPVHDKAAKLQKEGLQEQQLAEIERALNEINDVLLGQHRLNEGGVIGVLGLSLASFGALVMLLRGLEKLAKALGAERTAGIIHKVHHILHSVEEKVIDFAVPDMLSFAVYTYMRKHGFKLTSNKKKRSLTYEEYQSDHKSKMKVEKLIYSAFLLFLAFNGIKAAAHAGISLLGFAEGSATVVKGVEIGQAAGHISDIIELGIED